MAFVRAAVVALLLGAGLATPALAASGPVHCRLAPHQPAASRGGSGNFEVTVPRLICPGHGKPTQTGAQASNSGGAHSGVGGKLPFTGAEIALLVLVGVALTTGGLAVRRAGRVATA